MSASVSVESKDSHTVVSIHRWAIVVHIKATVDTRVKRSRRAIADKGAFMGSEFERLILSHNSTLDIFSQDGRTMPRILYLLLKNIIIFYILILILNRGFQNMISLLNSHLSKNVQ